MKFGTWNLELGIVNMDPHKPVRIGLRKNPAASANENPDFSDEGDELISVSVAVPQENLDVTVQPHTNSTMKILEGLVDIESEITTVTDSDSSNESIDTLADDVDLNLDPDYVPPPPEIPSTSRRSRSKGNALEKPTATRGAKNPATSSTLPVALPGGRKKAPIWAYFIADEKKTGGHIEKGAKCQANVGGGICAKRLVE